MRSYGERRRRRAVRERAAKAARKMPVGAGLFEGVNVHDSGAKPETSGGGTHWPSGVQA